jgi:hypothetical protein
LRRVICGTGRVQDALCTVLTVLTELTEPKTTQSTPSSDCTDTAGITTDIPVRRQQAPQTRQEKSGGEKPIVLVPPFKPQIQSRRPADRRKGEAVGEREEPSNSRGYLLYFMRLSFRYACRTALDGAVL